jgi:twinkle protein
MSDYSTDKPYFKFSVNDVLEKMIRGLRIGKIKGTTTYIPEFDNCWTWRKGETNIWTGYNNEGKSQFLIFLTLLKALQEDWKFAFFSPENFPPEEFFDDMIHTISGRTTDPEYKDVIDEFTYTYIAEILQERIKFLYLKPGDATVENILLGFSDLNEEYNLDGVIIDPWLKVKREDKSTREDLYAAEQVAILEDFARTNNLSLHLVMHQTTPQADETGNYPKPELYRIKGGGAYADAIDNSMFTWRPFRRSDIRNTEVRVGSDKIKKQKLVGLAGNEVKLLFNRRTNRYTGLDGRDFIDWGHFLPNEPKPGLKEFSKEFD